MRFSKKLFKNPISNLFIYLNVSVQCLFIIRKKRFGNALKCAAIRVFALYNLELDFDKSQKPI